MIARKTRPFFTSRLHGTACLCGREKKAWQVACAFHWNSLPTELQRRIWRLYKDPYSRGGERHRAAVFEATALIREQLKSGSASPEAS
jgi:hypothetical protein